MREPRYVRSAPRAPLGWFLPCEVCRALVGVVSDPTLDPEPVYCEVHSPE